jgi:hypothetical protein
MTDPREEMDAARLVVMKSETEIQTIKAALRDLGNGNEETDKTTLRVSALKVIGGSSNDNTNIPSFKILCSSPIEEQILSKLADPLLMDNPAQAISEGTLVAFEDIDGEVATLTVTAVSTSNKKELGASANYDVAPLCDYDVMTYLKVSRGGDGERFPAKVTEMDVAIVATEPDVAAAAAATPTAAAADTITSAVDNENEDFEDAKEDAEIEADAEAEVNEVSFMTASGDEDKASSDDADADVDADADAIIVEAEEKEKEEQVDEYSALEPDVAAEEVVDAEAVKATEEAEKAEGEETDTDETAITAEEGEEKETDETATSAEADAKAEETEKDDADEEEAVVVEKETAETEIETIEADADAETIAATTNAPQDAPAPKSTTPAPAPSTPSLLLTPTITVSLKLEFLPSIKHQQEKLYELLNQASKQKAKAIDRLRKSAAAVSRTGAKSAAAGGGAPTAGDTVANASSNSNAVKSGFLQKPSGGAPTKSAANTPNFMVRSYRKWLGPQSMARAIFPIAKNYLIFMTAVTLMHFKGDVLALPAPM